MSNETISIGEGFAFFRFHTIVYGHTGCHGINDKNPGMGYCASDWRKLRRG